jgi:hypothetical protein
MVLRVWLLCSEIVLTAPSPLQHGHTTRGTTTAAAAAAAAGTIGIDNVDTNEWTIDTVPNGYMGPSSTLDGFASAPAPIATTNNNNNPTSRGQPHDRYHTTAATPITPITTTTSRSNNGGMSSASSYHAMATCSMTCINGQCSEDEYCSCNDGWAGISCDQPTECGQRVSWSADTTTSISWTSSRFNWDHGYQSTPNLPEHVPQTLDRVIIKSGAPGLARSSVAIDSGSSISLNGLIIRRGATLSIASSATAISTSCDCSTGFTGPFCDVDIDECSIGTPCANGATCINSYGNYTCVCATGYLGSSCTECKSSFCAHHQDDATSS